MDIIELLNKNLNFNPELIIDVGANKGEWTKQVKNIFKNSKFILFEANPYCLQFLKDIDNVNICLLGNENKDNIVFYLDKNNIVSTGCSIMKELTPYYKDAIELLLPMRRLDSILESDIKIDFLKIDVQGSEILVLEGCGELLKKIDFILLETNILQYNKNAPMAYDIIKFMDENGFQLFEISEQHRFNNGLLFQADFIFINKKSIYLPTLTEEGIFLKN